MRNNMMPTTIAYGEEYTYFISCLTITNSLKTKDLTKELY